MKCNFCDQDATIHLTKVIDGEMQKLHLCVSCGQEKGYTDSTSFSVSDILLGTDQTLARNTGALTCSECGLTLSRLKKRGRLGCSKCYSTFSEYLDTIFQSMHESTHHQGRFPKRSWKTQAMRHQMETLEADLDVAVETELYEEAAQLRDQISGLKQDLKAQED